MAKVRAWYQNVAVRGLAIGFATALPFAGAMVVAFNWDRETAPSVAILTTGESASATPEAHVHAAGAGHDDGHADDAPHAASDGHEHDAGDTHTHAAGKAERHHDAGDSAHAHAAGTSHDEGTPHDETANHGHDGTTPHTDGSTTGAHAHDPGTPPAGHGHSGPAGTPPHTGGGHGNGGHSHKPPGGNGTTKPKPGGHGHPPTGPITSLDDPRVTKVQRAAAKDLIDRTTAAMKAFPTVEAVVGGGYSWIQDGKNGGFRHYVNWGYLNDGRELDPARIESIVTETQPGGGEKVVSAMYILALGKTMADVPDVAGALTTWHDHKDLCWNGNVLAGRLVNGKCTPGGTLIVTPPMLHVWMVPHPCGPFAGIEGHGQQTCGAHNH
jgi:hypothetical protein